MQRLIYGALTVYSVIANANQATADLVRFDFTGTITAAFDNDPASNPDTVFGAVVDNGDPVTGFFSFDNSAIETDSQNGATGSASAYEQNLPYKISVQMGGVVFESDGLFLTTVVNDFTTMSGGAPIDIFGTSDGVESGIPEATGSTILVDNVMKDGRISLQFNDFDATAFDSTALPFLLNLSDFESTEGRINGTEPGNLFYFATFSIDTIEAAAVPEPSSLALLGIVSLGLIATRCRRRFHKRNTCVLSLRRP